MRRLSADRLESTDQPKLLGERPPTAVASVALDPAEALRAQQKLAFDAAREQGRAEGLRDADAAVKHQVEKIAARLGEEHVAALKRIQLEQEHLKKLAQSLRDAVTTYAAEAEILAVEVAFAAVVRLLGEKSVERTLMVDLCRRVVNEYGNPPAKLRISEADLPLLEAIDVGIPVEVDRRLKPGQCVIDTARGQFESGLDVRLEALRKTLLTAVAEHRGQA